MEIQQLIAERYAGAEPTLAHETLTELHDYRAPVETVRQLMTEAALWKPNNRRIERRELRARFGELIQIKGSPDGWFQGCEASRTLIVL